MKENIEDYRKAGFINLDEYLLNNPGSFTYPYYIDGYDEKNFWTQVGKEDKEKFIYVKPREGKEAEDIYNVYAELLYQEMMKQVGIKTANFDASYYNGNVATLSENVLDDYDKNEFIINSSELLCSNRYGSDSSIEDLFNTIYDYCEYEHIDKKQEEKCYKDIQKACIADIFLLSTDRDINDLDFIAGKDDKENNVLELAPLCHNTYALGSNFSKDEIIDMLDNCDDMEQRLDLCYTDLGVPDDKINDNYLYWEDSLYYFIDKDEELEEFAKYCAKRMNIDEAILKVEEKTKSKIPQEYKEFVRASFDQRFRALCDCLDLDYYKLMDEKYYEYEMEEK